ncbi:MAG: hypothetical protein ACLPN6_25170 [Streptosporangiaceae bacterium]|jgi:hypothetical protein
MQLGKKLAAGFVRDDVQATAAGEAGLPPDGAVDSAHVTAPQVPSPPKPEPEPVAAG